MRLRNKKQRKKEIFRKKKGEKEKQEGEEIKSNIEREEKG